MQRKIPASFNLLTAQFRFDAKIDVTMVGLSANNTAGVVLGKCTGLNESVIPFDGYPYGLIG